MMAKAIQLRENFTNQKVSPMSPIVVGLGTTCFDALIGNSYRNSLDQLDNWGRAAFTTAWLLFLCKLVIGFVSAYDIFLTVKYVEFLPSMELNPVGRVLMNLDSGPSCRLDQIAGFIALKFCGNFATLVTIELLSYWKRRVAVLVALGITAFQLALLMVLTLQFLPPPN